MPKPKRPDFIRMFAWAVVIVLLLCTAYTLGIHHAIPEPDNRAYFGEMYGGLAALFSGLALAGVIVAIAMQREELKLQRKELRLTRAELKRQAAAQESSSKAVETQVELMMVAAKLNANSTLIAFYGHYPQIPEYSDRIKIYADETYRLLNEINLMSTQEDPQAGSQ